MNRLNEREVLPYEKTPDGVSLPAQKIYSSGGDSSYEQEELKIQANIQNVQSVIKDLEKIKAVSLRLLGTSRTDKIKTLTAIAARLEKHLNAKDALGRPLLRVKSVKAAFNRAYNATVSNTEALISGGKINVSSTVEEYCDLLIACTDSLQVMNAKIELLKTEASGEFSPDFDKSILDLLKQTGPEKDRLLSIRKRDYLLARVPVIPITSYQLNQQNLDKNGFKATTIGTNYVVLHNQLVFGVRSDLELKEGRKLIKPQDFLESIKPQLEKSLGQKLFLVTETAFKWDKGIWYWLMTAKDMARIQRAAPHFKVVRWGFAFN